MWYLIGEILVYMLITAMLWAAVGWWLRSVGQDTQVRRLAADFDSKLDSLQRSRDDYRDQAEQLAAAGGGKVEGRIISEQQRAQIATHVRKLETEISEGRERIASLATRLEEVGEKAEAREREAATLRQRLDTLGDAVRERDTRLQQLQSSAPSQETPDSVRALAALRAKLVDKEKTIAHQTRRIEELRNNDEADIGGNAAAQQDHARLLQVMTAQKNTIADLKRQLEARPPGNGDGDEATRLRSAVAERDAAIGKLRQRLDALNSARNDADPEPLMEVIRAQEKTIAGLNDKIRALNAAESRPAQRRAAPDARSGDLFDQTRRTRPAGLLDAPEGEPDDLKKIYGIGPVLETRLNELGVFYFRQIATFGEEEIAWIASKMPSFPNRIIRDRWVAQADQLSSGQNEAAP